MFLSSGQLDAFYAVAQTLHFSKAATQLNITQSALSQRVLALEEDLGVTLFLRSRSGIQLTEEAQRLLVYCQNRRGLEEELLAEMTETDGSLGGTIRIAGFSSVIRSVVMPALGEFIRKNTKLKIEFLTREIGEIEGLLKSGEVDFIVTDQIINREDVEGFLLGHEDSVLVRSKKFETPEYFLDHDPQDQTTKNYLKTMDGPSKKKNLKMKRRYLDDVYGLIDGVRFGFGFAVLPRHLLKGESDLEIVNPRAVLKTPVHLYYPVQPFYTKLHQAVVRDLKKNCGLFLK